MKSLKHICSLLLPVLLILSAASCSKNVPDTPLSPSPSDPDGGQVEEYFENNIIFNGNLSLFSYNRWDADAAANDNKRKVIVNHLIDLQGIGSREAIWNNYGHIKPVSYGGIVDFSYNDKVFNELEAAGLRYCLQMKVDAMAANPDNYGPEWEKNAVWYIRQVGQRYGSKPLYYIPMNEPDNAGQRIDGVLPLTTEQIVRVQEVVWRTLKEIDTDIKIASSPLCLLADNTTYASSGRQVLLAGITEYCDYFAFHKHVDIGDDGRNTETILWDLMDEAEEAGHPRKPALLNENGTYLTLGLVWPGASEEDARRFKSYWIGNDLVQMKSLGLKYIVVYSLAGSLGGPEGHEGEYNVVDVNTPVGDGYKVHELEYQAYHDLWHPQAHALSKGINGGFEEPNPDKSRGWTVSFRGRSFEGINRVEPKEWDYVSIVQDGARSGSYCLEMSPIDFTGTGTYDKKGITANRCRRLVEGLVPGRQYRLSAWAKLEKSADGSAPKAYLKAMGYSPLGHTSEKTLLYGYSEGKYACMELTFTAENPWVVISLEHNGKGSVSWDDISLTLESSPFH